MTRRADTASGKIYGEQMIPDAALEATLRKAGFVRLTAWHLRCVEDYLVAVRRELRRRKDGMGP
jgi:hypothetical protein